MRKTIVLMLLFAMALALAPRIAWAAASVNLKAMLASPVDLTVYSDTDRRLVIGHSHYTIEDKEKTVEIIGKTQYLDGERDFERILLEHQPAVPLPVVSSAAANFFAADGSLQLSESANLKSGSASCQWGHQWGDSSYQATLDFPADTYAGAASIIPLEYALKSGEQSVRFHVFDCAPKPTIFTVDAKLEDGEAHWTYYPGELAQMGLTPDLGWLNVLAKPFIPNITVFFDPRHGYQWVGSGKDRFYRGRSLVLVRNNPEPPISAGAQLTPSHRLSLDPPAK
jgi:hypothetical protein